VAPLIVTADLEHPGESLYRGRNSNKKTIQFEWSFYLIYNSMKYLRKFNESKIDLDIFHEIFQYVCDLTLDFKDLGLNCRVYTSSLPGSVSADTNMRAKAVLFKSIIIEITDTTYGFGINMDDFNSIVKRIKDYVEDYGCNFYVSRFDEHDNYYLNDMGYTTFDDYLKDPGNFYGFEIKIF
jgi:hypothetical protein